MKPLFALNWKMYRSGAEEVAACKNIAQLVYSNADIAIFPSFLSLYPLSTTLKNSGVLLGAQDCATADHGAYTGQIAAKALAQLGSTLCIIGHSERRMYLGETNEMVVKKVLQALAAGLEPIICVGETAHERAMGNTLAVIESMLKPVAAALKDHQALTPLTIAYEPVWAINSGTTPQPQEIEIVFEHIRNICSQLPQKIRVLYGGSVNSTTAGMLKKIPTFQGALIGKASLDFQEVQKIIHSALH
jgi:triosephosphate isomerase (TIM)